MIVSEREKILGNLRYELTVLTPSPLSGRSLSERTVRQVKNKQGLNKTLAYVPNIVDRAIPSVLKLPTPPQPDLNYTASAYYQLGERLVPFYAHFSDWINYKGSTYSDSDRKSALVFGGRDSLGFLYAFSQRFDSPWAYSPGNRAAFRNQYWSNKRAEWETEQQAAAAFYLRRGLTDKDLFLVDFGFGGTIFRHELLSTMQEGLSIGKAKILLAVLIGCKDVVTNKNRRFVFDPKRKNEFEQTDQDIRFAMDAYFMEFSKEDVQLPPPLENPRQISRLGFLRTFQELAAYIKEAPPESFTPVIERKTEVSLGIDSVYGLVAKYAFFRGLMGSDIANMQTKSKDVAEAVTGFYKHTKRYPRTFGILTDLSDKVHENPSVKAAIKRANRALKRQKLAVAY